MRKEGGVICWIGDEKYGCCYSWIWKTGVHEEKTTEEKNLVGGL